MPIVSVIVPVYNTEQYLPQCIDSILTQTFTDFELILVNDGSTDNSGAICDEYAQKDNRIIVIHKENEGQSSARNVGLKIKKGEFITFVDSDDYYLESNTIKDSIKVLQTTDEIDIVQFPLIHPERNISKHDITIFSKEELFSLWIKESVITNYLCDKVFRSDLFKGFSFPKGKIYEDRYVFPILLNRCRNFRIIPFGGYYYRQHSAQTTRKEIDNSILISKINADINILDLMPNSLVSGYCIVYYRALSNYMHLTKLGLEYDFPVIDKHIFRIIFSSIYLGIKFRLIICKLLGFKIYQAIFCK